MTAGSKGTVAFDNEKYLAEQSEAILDRMHQVGGKLHLEFGGKLLYDYHAARVLPGFDPNVKMRLLQELKQKAGGHYALLKKNRFRNLFGCVDNCFSHFRNCG